MFDDAFNKKENFICNLKLSRLILQDNCNFPWLILVPRVNDIIELTDLTVQDRYILLDEIVFIEEIMKKTFKPDKLNVASFGNKVPQLHIHVVARYRNDLAWPDSVFGAKETPYSLEASLAVKMH